ncbi:hypothetical protein [Streptomyces fragilis]|uniref:Secreted protein n=1 Tax=Streptomyces fragilis TaxID=67301 RepID=A0ABV2YNR6_9ACTN|nr:hypothetical protein [Streptomyces fragilis]
MSSTRTRAPLALLLAAALLSASSPSHGQASAGTALSTDGAQSSGVVGHDHAKVGETWWFALPVPENTSREPIEITDVSVLHVPDGIEILGYGAFDLNDTEGLPLLAREGEADMPDFAQLKNYIDDPVKVGADTSSDIFFVAKMKIVAPPRGNARQCRFAYQQDDRQFTQTLDCEVSLRTGTA